MMTYRPTAWWQEVLRSWGDWGWVRVLTNDDARFRSLVLTAAAEVENYRQYNYNSERHTQSNEGHSHDAVLNTGI